MNSSSLKTGVNVRSVVCVAAHLLFRGVGRGLGSVGVVTIVVVVRDLELQVLCIPFPLHLSAGPSLLQSDSAMSHVTSQELIACSTVLPTGPSINPFHRGGGVGRRGLVELGHLNMCIISAFAYLTMNICWGLASADT